MAWIASENAWVFAFCYMEIAWIRYRNGILANESDVFVLQQFRIWRKLVSSLTLNSEAKCIAKVQSNVCFELDLLGT